MPVGLIIKEIAEIVPWTWVILSVIAIVVGESMGIPLAAGIIDWIQTIGRGLIDWIVNQVLGGVSPW